MSGLSTVDFQGDQLEVISEQGAHWVVVRRVCESLGVDADSQRKRLQDQDRAPWAVTVMTTATGPDGKNYTTFCIELDSLPMWLATIDASRVRSESRDKLLRYQRECARVLRDHLFGPLPVQVNTDKLFSDPAALRGLLIGYVDRVIALEGEVATSRPKVDVYDRIVASGDTVGFREACKLIHAGTGAKEPEVRTFLINARWVQRLGGRLAPASYGQEKNYVTSREREVTTPDVSFTDVPEAEHKRLLRTCQGPKCRRLFKGVPWQTHCTNCQPRDGGRSISLRSKAKLQSQRIQ